MALDIIDTSHFESTLDHAARHGHFADLRAKLDWLDTFEGRSRTRCVLSPSHAPHTFEVIMFRRRGVKWRTAFIGHVSTKAMTINPT